MTDEAAELEPEREEPEAVGRRRVERHAGEHDQREYRGREEDPARMEAEVETEPGPRVVDEMESQEIAQDRNHGVGVEHPLGEGLAGYVSCQDDPRRRRIQRALLSAAWHPPLSPCRRCRAARAAARRGARS